GRDHEGDLTAPSTAAHAVGASVLSHHRKLQCLAQSLVTLICTAGAESSIYSQSCLR
ncbi:hypothetical protein P7K49_021115, partial [Saguinus oedipus]